MTALPSIPRLYTALAECLAVGIYALPLGLRFGPKATLAISAVWALVLCTFLQATGSVPLAWWIPCMAAAVAMQYLYLWLTRTISLLEAGYVCARARQCDEVAAVAAGKGPLSQLLLEGFQGARRREVPLLGVEVDAVALAFQIIDEGGVQPPKPALHRQGQIVPHPAAQLLLHLPELLRKGKVGHRFEHIVQRPTAYPPMAYWAIFVMKTMMSSLSSSRTRRAVSIPSRCFISTSRNRTSYTGR